MFVAGNIKRRFIIYCESIRFRDIIYRERLRQRCTARGLSRASTTAVGNVQRRRPGDVIGEGSRASGSPAISFSFFFFSLSLLPTPLHTQRTPRSAPADTTTLLFPLARRPSRSLSFFFPFGNHRRKLGTAAAAAAFLSSSVTYAVRYYTLTHTRTHTHVFIKHTYITFYIHACIYNNIILLLR